MIGGAFVDNVDSSLFFHLTGQIPVKDGLNVDVSFNFNIAVVVIVAQSSEATAM